MVVQKIKLRVINMNTDQEIAKLVEEVRKLREDWKNGIKRELELSEALCNMLFVFTCFEQQGLTEYPEDMQKKLREYRQRAAEAYVGHELSPLPVLSEGIELNSFEYKPIMSKYPKLKIQEATGPRNPPYGRTK